MMSQVIEERVFVTNSLRAMNRSKVQELLTVGIILEFADRAPCPAAGRNTNGADLKDKYGTGISLEIRFGNLKKINCHRFTD
jgi:hypothetical protein